MPCFHFFVELAVVPPGGTPPRRLYFRGSVKPSSVNGFLLLLLQLTLATHLDLVSGPLAAFPKAAPGFSDEDAAANATVLRAIDLFAGAKTTVGSQRKSRCQVKGTYQIIRFACSLGWSVAASWHLSPFSGYVSQSGLTYLSHGKTLAQQQNLLIDMRNFGRRSVSWMLT